MGEHTLGEIVDGVDGAGDDMGVDFEAAAEDSQGLLDIFLFVHFPVAGDHMDDLPVGGNLNRACALERPLHVVTGDAMASVDRADAGAVRGGDVVAGDAQVGTGDLFAGLLFG